MTESYEYPHMEAFKPEGYEVMDYGSLECQICFEKVPTTEFLKHVREQHSSEVESEGPAGITGLLDRLNERLETEIKDASKHPEVQLRLVDDQFAIRSIIIQQLRRVGDL